MKILLDDAIFHMENFSEYYLNLAKKYADINTGTFPGYRELCDEKTEMYTELYEIADQIAKWLRDYKRLLAIESGVDVKCSNCRHDGSGDGNCDLCYQYSRWEERKDERI